MLSEAIPVAVADDYPEIQALARQIRAESADTSTTDSLDAQEKTDPESGDLNADDRAKEEEPEAGQDVVAGGEGEVDPEEVIDPGTEDPEEVRAGKAEAGDDEEERLAKPGPRRPTVKKGQRSRQGNLGPTRGSGRSQRASTARNKPSRRPGARRSAKPVKRETPANRREKQESDD
jgi:hypothetical protein